MRVQHNMKMVAKENIIIEKNAWSLQTFHIHNRKLRCLFNSQLIPVTRNFILVLPFLRLHSTCCLIVKNFSLFSCRRDKHRLESVSVYIICEEEDEALKLERFSCAHTAVSRAKMFICSFDLFLSMRWFLSQDAKCELRQNYSFVCAVPAVCWTIHEDERRCCDEEKRGRKKKEKKVEEKRKSRQENVIEFFYHVKGEKKRGKKNKKNFHQLANMLP